MAKNSCYRSDVPRGIWKTGKYPVVFCLLLYLFTSSNLLAEPLRQEVYDTLPANQSRYLYLKKQLTVEFRIVFRQDMRGYFGSLLQIQSNENEYYNVFLDCQENFQQLLVYSREGIQKLPLPSLHDHSSLVLKLSFFQQKKDFMIEVDDNRYYIENLGFDPASGYKFLFTPNDKIGTDPNGNPVFRIEDIYFIEASDAKLSGDFWYWFIFVLVVDLLLFGGIQLRKRLLQRRRALLVTLPGEPAVQVVEKITALSPESAVYLFGGFHIYDEEGNNITKKFTPLLKELFLLLVIHTPDKGITSEKLKDILWFDKSEQSAKNNRAVNFGKLRTLLDTLGDYDLNNNTGNWILKIENKAVYVDYFDYMELYTKGELTRREDILKLLDLTHRGSFLNDVGYEWLDRFKTTISDYVIDTLIRYSSTIRIPTDPDLALQIADTVALFDPLNEYVLQLRIRTYTAIGKHSLAKNCYEKFCKEYVAIYGEKFPRSFSDLRVVE